MKVFGRLSVFECMGTVGKTANRRMASGYLDTWRMATSG